MKPEDILNEIVDSGSTWIEARDTKIPKDFVKRVFKEQTFVSHAFFQKAEEKVARLIFGRIHQIQVPDEKLNVLISLYEIKNGINLDQGQKEAVKMMCTNSMCILLGGPGTGKTAVLKAAFFVLKKIFPTFTTAFTAPTGKAARRITESTGFEASTIQKKIGDTGGEFLSEVAEDVLFIDESSMLDLETMQKVMVSLSNRTRLILIGDIDQLPSVEPGAVLRDLVDTGIIPTVSLTKTFRQSDESNLFENITIVRNGCAETLKMGNDFLISQVSTEKVVRNALTSYRKNQKIYGEGNVVLLSPYRDGGTINSYNLNRQIQRQRNKGQLTTTPSVRIFQERNGQMKEVEFREGDLVIQLRNTDGRANGDVGKVLGVKGNRLTVDFGGKIYTYQGEELEDLDLAYCLSVNKSQGSEYDCVIVVLLSEHKSINRNLVYTAITRARKKVEIITDNLDYVTSACKTQAAWERKTFLREEFDIVERQCRLLQSII